MLKSIRGTRDLLPPDTETWNFVEQTARAVFRAYNFHEIRTPVIEPLELFQRSVGADTDIVSKEMFTWLDDQGLTQSLMGVASSQPSAEGFQKRVQDAIAYVSSRWKLGGLPQILALRPENTAGVVRAYIEHKLWERPGVQKLYYIGPQFRRERPQKGRYRQFYQIGAESIGPPAAGSESPLRDAEMLEMLAA